MQKRIIDFVLGLRLFALSVLLLAGIRVQAQSDSSLLIYKMSELDIALTYNQSLLPSLLHPDVSFGHSNGWVQTMDDIMNDFKNGMLLYKRIQSDHAAVLMLTDNMATTAIQSEVEGKLKGNDFKISLHIMQVWIKTEKGWQLYARQSAKQ